MNWQGTLDKSRRISPIVETTHEIDKSFDKRRDFVLLTNSNSQLHTTVYLTDR